MLTKTEVTAKTTAEEDAAIKLWETKIDAALATHYGSTSVDFSGTARVRGRIVELYQAGGWSVTYHDDQRDGASLTFR